jgi:hypothetical protein
MSRSKKILVVSAFGPVALMLTTRWGVLAGADCMRNLCVPERVVKPGPSVRGARPHTSHCKTVIMRRSQEPVGGQPLETGFRAEPQGNQS